WLARVLFAHKNKIYFLKKQPQNNQNSNITTLVVDINTTKVLYLVHQQDAGSQTEQIGIAL
ncbi:hypothetical protein ACI0X7_004303, partial [Cronobacter sakazakii]